MSTQVRYGLNKLVRIQAERRDQGKKPAVELETRFPWECLEAPLRTDFISSAQTDSLAAQQTKTDFSVYSVG